MTDTNPLRRIHRLMGITSPFQDQLESTEGVKLAENGENLIFKDGGIYLIDSKTGEYHAATIYIKDNTHLASREFDKLFKSIRGFFGYGDSRKIHLTRCGTINKMIADGRFDRYHGSSRKDHIRRVLTRGHFESDEKLRVCWNCIKELNLRYRMQNADSKPNFFDFKSFFDLEIGKTPEPERNEKSSARARPKDWHKDSLAAKKSANWICECCGVNLIQNQGEGLYETHHIDGWADNNAPENLEALCIMCHNKRHKTKTVSPILQELRYEQGLSHICPKCGS